MTITESKSIDERPEADDEAIEAYADKVFGDLLGAMGTFATTIGVRLGWYEAMADAGAVTSVELAMATDTDERYAREWLEHQTVAGYVEVDGVTAPPTERRYSLPPAGVEVLTNRESLSYMAPFPGFLSTLAKQFDVIEDAYRTGAGVAWHEHGDGARCGQAEANRPMFLQLLGQEYLPTIPDVDAALRAGGRVADVGCGMGWSSIGIASAYPTATVDGYDIDAPSVEQASIYAAEHGVSERVRFQTVNVAEVDEPGYHLVLALECVHDMPDPVSVLTAMRGMVRADGAVIVMDERVGDTFTGEADAIEQLMYGFSLMCCLPDGRSAASSVATGTVMRRPVFEQYAFDAGFTDVEVLPIENDFFRFYRLRG